MQCDYKITGVTRDGLHTVCSVTFYAGDITTQDEQDPISRKAVSVTRYRRSQVVSQNNYSFDGDLDDMTVWGNLDKTLQDVAVQAVAMPIDAQKLPPPA